MNVKIINNNFVVAVAVIFISFSCYAKDYGNVTVSEVTSIYDADTFTVNIEGYPPIVGERIPVRLLSLIHI